MTLGFDLFDSRASLLLCVRAALALSYEYRPGHLKIVLSWHSIATSFVILCPYRSCVERAIVGGIIREPTTTFVVQKIHRRSTYPRAMAILSWKTSCT
jgi:hypothetical protein